MGIHTMFNLQLLFFVLFSSILGNEIPDVESLADGSGSVHDLGALAAFNRIKDIMAVENKDEVDAKSNKVNHASQFLKKIRQYQSDPDDNIQTHWSELMIDFSPDTSFTFTCNGRNTFFLEMIPSKPLFRGAWLENETFDGKSTTVAIYDPNGDYVYHSKNKVEGLIAFEATTFGLYTIEFSRTSFSFARVLTFMSAADGLEEITFAGNDTDDTNNTSILLMRTASEVKRSARFFQRRRHAHATKVWQNLSWVTISTVCCVACSIVTSLLQVACVKHMVRKRIRTYIL